MAYFAYKDYYLKCEEVATGEGYADMVYIPKPGKGVPMLLVELKWNKDADTAISQIKEKGYARGLKDFGREILLVGIPRRRVPAVMLKLQSLLWAIT